MLCYKKGFFMKILLLISALYSYSVFALTEVEQDRFYWPKSALQNHSLKVVIEDKISSYMAPEVLNDVFSEWNSTVSDFVFYSTPEITRANIDSNNLSDYRNDPSFGIYHVTNWASELGENTIAVTANYYNTKGILKDGINYYQLVHSDILINFLHHSFSSVGEPNRFDLPSVLVHELGHMIGMRHAPYEYPDSVMRRTASVIVFFRNLTSYDIDTARNFYEIEIPQDVIVSEGSEQLIIHRLLADGTSTVEFR
jgi:hypothetical protein